MSKTYPKMTPYAERYPEHEVLDVAGYPYPGGIQLNWAVQNVGIGMFRFSIDVEGNLKIDNETMGPEFVKHVLNKWVDNATMEDSGPLKEKNNE